MLPGAPIAFSGAPGAPVAPLAPYSATLSARRCQRHTAPCRKPDLCRALHHSLWQACCGLVSPRLMLALYGPYSLANVLPSYMPRPLSQPPFMQAQFEELARQSQDTEAQELEGQRMSRPHNLNAVDARVRSATSVRGSKHTRRKEQAPEGASSQLVPQQSQTPSGVPPLGNDVLSTGVSKTVAPPTPTGFPQSWKILENPGKKSGHGKSWKIAKMQIFVFQEKSHGKVMEISCPNPPNRVPIVL